METKHRWLIFAILVVIVCIGVTIRLRMTMEEEMTPVAAVTTVASTHVSQIVRRPKSVLVQDNAVPANDTPEKREYVVKRGDTLWALFGKDANAVCELNTLTNCDYIVPGQKLLVPNHSVALVKARATASKTKTARPVQSTEVSVFYWRKVGGAPLKTCGKDPEQVNEEAWISLSLTDTEKSELRMLVKEHQFERRHVLVGERYAAVTFCGKDGKSVIARQNAVTAWPQETEVIAERYTLSTGRILDWVQNCGNWTLSTEVRQPEPPAIADIEPEPEPPEVLEVPEETEVLPVHAQEGDVIPCELQVGVGVYTNRVYRGRWEYGEGICYVFKQGEWQHGPGFYAMGGAGESRMSSYRGEEYGIGLQYGVQRNFINDRGFKATFEVKGRWLFDRMDGHNSEGYWVNQEGQKLGLYGSYYERHEDNLVGVVAEYWKGTHQSVKSSWSGQKVQDRGSLGVYGVYEHGLTDNDAWRLRWIAGVQHTNWDEQNWFRLTPEFRYKEWLMFGPQIALPIGGISKANQPLSHGDMTTFGAFVRVELGTEIRKQDADAREAQLEFISNQEVLAPPE